MVKVFFFSPLRILDFRIFQDFKNFWKNHLFAYFDEIWGKFLILG